MSIDRFLIWGILQISTIFLLTGTTPTQSSSLPLHPRQHPRQHSQHTIAQASVAHDYTTRYKLAQPYKLTQSLPIVKTAAIAQAAKEGARPYRAPVYSLPGIGVAHYGAPNIVGPTREPCDDEQTVVQAKVLTPNDDWEQILTDQAKAGDVFLLQEGIYQAEEKVWLPAGDVDAPITIKPYACAALTIRSSIRPNSYNIIAGLRLEAEGISDTKWVIRIDGKNREPLTDIVVRNNTILGGTIDALRINDDVRNVTVEGNHIDGGRDGHGLFITSSTPNSQTANSQTATALPTAITVTHNRLTKQHFTAPSEDMFQVRDVGAITFTHNTCADGYHMEQCIDIKTTTVPIRIAHNLFVGDTLHQAGTGEDDAGGCMVIHEEDDVADQHLIEHNLFHHCQGTVIRFSTGDDEVQSSALFQYNLLVQAPRKPQLIPIETATNLHFLHNTVIFGRLKLGNSDHTRLPQGLVLQHNIFYQTHIEDNLLPPDSTYSCTHNLFYQVAGGGFTAAPCTNTISADPRFVSVAFEDFHLQTTSPALGGGEAGVTIGALSIGTPPIALEKHLFLPLILLD